MIAAELDEGQRVWLLDHCGAVAEGTVLDTACEDVALRVGNRLLLRKDGDLFESRADAIYQRARYCAEQVAIHQREYLRLARELHQLGQAIPLPVET